MATADSDSLPTSPRDPGTKPLTVGVLGGGQLARMMALDAARLGVRMRFYDPDDATSALGLGERFVGAWDDEARLAEFIAGCDVITLENEWAELDTLERLRPADIPLLPSAATLGWIANKLTQKDRAREAGIPVGDYRACNNVEEALAAAKDYGYPLVLKAPTHGYDGYGNATVRDDASLREAFPKLARGGVVLAEAFVPFVRELAVLVARRADGVAAVYPVAFTRQEDHRCVAVELPAPSSEAVQARARELTIAVAEAFEIVGIMAAELFELPSGELLLNEISPRPHNSGHYTIDACSSSQFDNHLRAILGWPLGDTSLRRPAAVMVNILGQREGIARPHAVAEGLRVTDANLHIYGKREVRPQRKMGHVTVVGDQLDSVRDRAMRAAAEVRL